MGKTAIFPHQSRLKDNQRHVLQPNQSCLEYALEIFVVKCHMHSRASFLQDSSVSFPPLLTSVPGAFTLSLWVMESRPMGKNGHFIRSQIKAATSRVCKKLRGLNIL